jgi:protein involved in polysaccharide export with SLBB domain
MLIRLLSCLLLISLAGACGCAGPTMRTGVSSPVLSSPASPFGGYSCQNSSELSALWHQRATAQDPGDYPIGPGDLLRISVAGIEQLEKQEVRVSGDGTIDLPYAGSLTVAHMTDDELARELRMRLQEYIRDPQVSILDEEDKSRTVRVMGLVNKPGLIVLSTSKESLMDALAEAGGLRDDASQRILFIPTPATRLSDQEAMAGGPNSTPGGDFVSASYEYQRAAPIVKNLHDDAQRSCFDLPARPGDTLIVPVAGNVTVDGWVANPSAVNLTPGMTATGAVAAAGGALFSTKAEILRTAENSERSALPIDLSAIKAGRAPDPPLEAGDVVIVKRSIAGAVPYTAYFLLQRFSSGVAIPTP